jgi:RNA ligase (TIGR02306 family)
MSTFKVTVERLETVWAHPNADKLALAKVEGMSFQFCVQKDAYKAGDLVIYFPVDSLLPANLIAHFGISNFLAGKDKNRLKTVRLRGQVSQGFVCRYPDESLNALIGLQGARTMPEPWSDVGLDMTEVLGVTKYEPPEVPCKAGSLVPHPDGVSTYDIEGCQRYPRVVERLMDQPVFITEKVEGSNHYTSILANGEVIVGQRNHQIKPVDGAVHDWWKAADEAGHFKILRDYQDKNPGKMVTIRSEICGPSIQDNIYGLAHKELYAFDVMVDGKYLAPEEFHQFCMEYAINHAPILCAGKTLREWLDGKTIEQASNGKTKVGHKDILREGIVIKPLVEQRDEDLSGRLFLKMRDPIYLDKTGN